MSAWLAIPGGRRAKWAVLATWLAAMMIAGGAGLPEKFTDAEENESTSFLPGDAESTKALELTERLQNGELAGIVIAYRRDGGLTAADRRKIADDRAALNRLPRDEAGRGGEGLGPTSRFGAAIRSEDGTGALLIAQITTDGEADTIIDAVDNVRERVTDPPGGLEAKVTGGAGFAADAIDVFQGINGTLLLAAGSLVLLLLILIYRSPLFFWIPLIAVGFAEFATRSVGYGLTELGVTVNGQSSGILSILVLGAGTDYALLLVARYREELRRHEDKHEAIALALRTAGPAIAASAATVIAALLCLMLADVNGTSGLGPVAALGIFIAALSMLTLLPAMLVIFGRRAFWPFIPRFGDDGTDEIHGRWRGVGERVARAPRRTWIGVVALLAVLSLGLLNFDDGLTQGNQFVEDVEAVAGQQLISESFPGGSNAPTDVVVRDPAKVGAVTAALRGFDGVSSVQRAARGDAGVLLQAVLEPDPYSTEAFDLIDPLREAVKSTGGPETLVGGPTAVESDLREAAARDNRVIVPVALLVVFLILVALLRSVTAPLLLIGTVILSFAAALGVGAVVFDVLFGFPGSDPGLPLYAFIFLVALGIDYNIFLMARVREETLVHGTSEGMLRGVAVTGGVITSAGIVLAGTFAVLGVLPLVFLSEIGFVVAFGVLLDTFLVRSVLVPALVLDIGPKTWWPSELAARSESSLDEEASRRVAKHY